MPIYEYACDDCQKNFEMFVGIRDAPVQECKHCAGKNIRKLISNCSFQLKGTGWYKTDYASKDSKDSSGANKAPAEEKSSTDKSETASKDGESKKTSKDGDSAKSSSSEKAA
jgi:putative FmdB family regulatory protein